MRVAVQNPGFLFLDQSRNYDGYNYAFLQQYRPAIYLTGWKAIVSRGWKWRQRLHALGLEPDSFEFIFSTRELRRKADVLLCFNQAACLPPNRPPRDFPGLKIWHVMDFNYRASESYRALREGGVGAVMAYTALDRHCDFFQRYHPAYLGQTIPVPFGFGARFEPRTPFADRLPKAVAMGAINPVDQDAKGPSPLDEYAAFYREHRFSQAWRRQLMEHEDSLGDVLASFLPKYPEISRPGDDPVVVLNRYGLYANDDSICHFPPARTYEGAACGAAMVAPDHPCFRDLGFEPGVNCLLHRPMDVEDFASQIRSWAARPAELAELARRGCELVRTRYAHPTVAAGLYEEVRHRWEGRG
jgi:hypothetical protein